jgi:hypothetical protein
MTDDAAPIYLRWKIDKDLELYRFYLDVAIKAAVFLMGVTGAIASYVLATTAGRVLSLALLFPALMNAGFTVLFFASRDEAGKLAAAHKKTCDDLHIAPFNMDPLRAVCTIFCLMCAAATVGLLALMIFTLGRR